MLYTLNNALWGPATLALLLGSGIYLTIRLRFLPWRRLGYALRSALGREARRTGGEGVSPFSALMTALAATIGTGNIVGVATALVAGGQGPWYGWSSRPSLAWPPSLPRVCWLCAFGGETTGASGRVAPCT